MKKILAFLICTIFYTNNSFSQYTVTSCQTVADALIGPDRNEFAHSSPTFTVNESYLHNFTPPTLPNCINNADITSLLISIDITDITTSPECNGINLFGNILENCALTNTTICAISQEVLTTGCNNFGGGQSSVGLYTLDLASCGSVDVNDIIGVDIVPVTGGNSCPESTTGISDDLVSLTYQICIQYTYDQDVTPCTNTITLPCDDGDDCTTNDVIIVDDCDNSIICSPCMGEETLISVNMTVADSPLIAGDSTELIFTFSGGVAPYTIYYTADGVLDSLTNVLMSPAIDTIFPVMTTTYQFINIIDDNGCMPDGLAPIIIELPVCPSPDEMLGIFGPTDVCEFETASYSVNEIPGVTSYNWSVAGGGIIAGQGTSSIVVEFFPAGIGSVSVSTESDCGQGPVSEALDVFVEPILFLEAVQGNPTVCQNSIENYSTSDAGGCYEWTVPSEATIIAGQNTSSITVDWGLAESGSVTVAEFCSCFPQIEEIFVNVVPEPTALIESPENLSCNNQIVTLDGSMSTGEGFEWQDGGGNIVGTNSTLDVSNSDTYTLTMSNTQFGLTCTNTTTETVLEIPDVEPPLVTCPNNLSISIPIGATGVIVENDLALVDYSDNCEVSSVEYVISGATNIADSGDNAGGNFFNTGTSTIQYIVTDNSGIPAVCSFELTVSANEDPCADAAGAASSASISTYEICEGQCTTLSISDPFGGLAPFKFFYNINGVLDSFENVITFPFTQEFCLTQSTGFRVLYGLDANGCIIESDGFLQTVHVYPIPTVDLGEDVNLCNDESITLSPSISSNASNISFATTLNFYFAPWINDSDNPMFADLEISGLPNTTITDPVNEIISVCLNLETDAAQDIALYLVAPNGAELELSTGNGGDEDDYINTCFTPTASTNITTGTAPFTGNFQPEGNWNNLIGENFNGTWSLRVSDDDGFSAGILNYWQITFDIPNNLSYSWSPNNENTQNIEAQTGIYSVTVSGGNCNGTDEIEIANTPTLAEVAPFPNLSCDTPIITIDGSNSLGDSFTWTDEDGVLLGIQNTLDVDLAACYTLTTYSDNLTCSDTITVCVEAENDVLPNAGNNNTLNLCASATPVNLYDYLGGNVDINGTWSPVLTGGYLGTLIPNQNTGGIYTYSVTNICGTATADLTISIAPFEIQNQITDISCFGESNGIVTFTSNGTPPFSYEGLTTGNLSEDGITDLPAGNYTITVTDSNTCETEHTFTISQPNEISVDVSIIDESCTEGNDGSIEALITGGIATDDYSISWTNSAGDIIGSTNFPQNLSAGSYSLQVTDNNNCQFSDEYSVALPNTPIILSVEEDSLSCTAQPEGEVAIFVNPNGSNSLFYQWSNGVEGTNELTNLIPGTYSVSVTNENSCLVTAELNVLGNLLPAANAGEDTAYCLEGELILNATLPQTYTGRWIYPTELFLDNFNSPTSSITDYQEGYFNLIWSLSNEDCPAYSQDSLNLYIPSIPLAINDSLVYSFSENVFLDELGRWQQADVLSNDVFNQNWQIAEILNPAVSGEAIFSNNLVNYSTSSQIAQDNFTYQIYDNYCPNLSDTANVSIKIQDFPDKIIGITPGVTDGINDRLVLIEDLGQFPNSKIIIHNRWGDIVFEQENYRNTWDGTYQKTNAPLPAGTYYYSLWLDVGEGEIKYGAVVIIR